MQSEFRPVLIAFRPNRQHEAFISFSARPVARDSFMGISSFPQSTVSR